MGDFLKLKRGKKMAGVERGVYLWKNRVWGGRKSEKAIMGVHGKGRISFINPTMA